jgi:hypothetical protein
MHVKCVYRLSILLKIPLKLREIFDIFSNFSLINKGLSLKFLGIIAVVVTNITIDPTLVENY